jgi:hypothetical protein
VLFEEVWCAVSGDAWWLGTQDGVNLCVCVCGGGGVGAACCDAGALCFLMPELAAPSEQCLLLMMLRSAEVPVHRVGLVDSGVLHTTEIVLGCGRS